MCENCRKQVELIERFQIDKYQKYYDEHIYLLKYEGYIREKILEYKFCNKSYYYKTFSKILLNNKKMYDILKSYDIIIPVPIHAKRKRERGYNQTVLISKELSKNITVLQYLNILKKKENTQPQSSLNKEQRIENAKNVYELKNNIKLEELKILEQKRILIFDDIYTTGSTADECAKIIKKLNPKKIGILTIAKD